VEIRPTPAGEWRHLVSLNADQPIWNFSYSLDHKWIYYGDKDSAGKDSLFRISLAGGQPERLGEFPFQYLLGEIQISPDGRSILLYSLYSRGNETWLLENFEPKEGVAR
jgi:Tol biopolymer transport system component